MRKNLYVTCSDLKYYDGWEVIQVIPRVVNNADYCMAVITKDDSDNKAMNDYAHAIDESWYRELYDDYKSRCEKANNQLKIIMQIIKEQPTRDVEDDEWIENRLISVVNILQNGSENK